MDKREEIREGIKDIIKSFEDASPDAGYGYECVIMSHAITQYLHSQGCMLKVDNGKDLTGCCIARLESLIEEVRDG